MFQESYIPNPISRPAMPCREHIPVARRTRSMRPESICTVSLFRHCPTADRRPRSSRTICRRMEIPNSPCRTTACDAIPSSTEDETYPLRANACLRWYQWKIHFLGNSSGNSVTGAWPLSKEYPIPPRGNSQINLQWICKLKKRVASKFARFIYIFQNTTWSPFLFYN